MRAVTLERPGSVLVDEVDDPSPGSDEIVVRVAACGVCGTDLHIADGHFAPTPYPIVPGHEFAGTVVAVGSDVAAVQEGERVAVDPSLFCGYCEACRKGRGNLCANWGATGDTVDGAFAELVRVPARQAYRLPDSVTFEQGALVEPLSCAVHGVRRLSVEPGERVLVVGAGTMGLLLVQLLAASGALVTAVDRVATKLQLAEGFGAVARETDLAEALRAGWSRHGGFDAVVDVTGVAALMEQALGGVRRGGRFLVFGVAPSEARMSISPFSVYNDEITVLGSMAVLHSFGAALDLIATGRVSTDGLVTHRFGLDRYEEALRVVRDGQGVKIHVLPEMEDRR